MNQAWIRRGGVAAIALCAGFAAAQDATPKQDSTVLGGPKVRETAPPGEQAAFGPGSRKGTMERPLPPRAYMQALNVLRADGAPPEVRLTGEQSERLQAILAEFETASREYREKNMPRVRVLRSQIPEEERPRVDEAIRRSGLGQGPRPTPNDTRRPEPGPRTQPSPDPMVPTDLPEGVDASREELRRIWEGVPKVQDAYAKMWAELSDAQKPVVQAELDRLRQAEDEKQRADAERRLREKQATGSPDPKPQAGAPSGDLDIQKLPEPMRRRLEMMTPADREEALRRLRSLDPEERSRLIERSRQGVTAAPGTRPTSSKERPPASKPE